MFPEPGAPAVILEISTSGSPPAPADAARYQNKDNWQVSWRSSAADVPTPAQAGSIELDSGTQHVMIHLTGPNLPAGDGRRQFWVALFVPPPGMAAIPSVSTFTPENPPPAPGAPRPSFFAPLKGADQPDLLLNGTFLAGGNTKPIYTFQEQTSIYTAAFGRVLGFVPGFTSKVLINQGALPPNHRTRFDPDSIAAALSFWRVDNIGRGALYGLTSKVSLLGGEFSRSDPSSNIMTGFLETVVLRRVKLSKSGFFVLYPVAGLEAGRNLNHPSQLAGMAVDLSHYSAILRGVTGSDAILGMASKNRSSNVFAITGSYRLRIPATDEPLIRSAHGQTQVELTTRARHWVEVDVTYSPWQWAYLALNAKYQYGALPPLFNVVDQQVSLGFLLQAKQRHKPSLPQ
jgi:hypothetical protein